MKPTFRHRRPDTNMPLPAYGSQSKFLPLLGRHLLPWPTGGIRPFLQFEGSMPPTILTFEHMLYTLLLRIPSTPLHDAHQGGCSFQGPIKLPKNKQVLLP